MAGMAELVLRMHTCSSQFPDHSDKDQVDAMTGEWKHAIGTGLTRVTGPAGAGCNAFTERHQG